MRSGQEAGKGQSRQSTGRRTAVYTRDRRRLAVPAVDRVADLPGAAPI
jgi:hypothetical protein